MRNFQDTFQTCRRSFISTFSICMTIPLTKTVDLVAFTEEILNGKLHFLCNVSSSLEQPFRYHHCEKYRNFTWFAGVENFAERHNFRESPETMQKLCLSAKIPRQEIRSNYGIFRSAHSPNHWVYLTRIFYKILLSCFERTFVKFSSSCNSKINKSQKLISGVPQGTV